MCNASCQTDKSHQRPKMHKMTQVEPRKVRCPQCGAMSVYDISNSFRPFCSERCKLMDLGAWANDAYAIAGSPLEAPLSADGAIVPPPPDADRTMQ